MITLGIIGVVAAMTLPTVITNYQKKQTVSQLKSTYSILSQAMTRSQADYGDPSTWDINSINGIASTSDNSNVKTLMEDFYKKHLAPYVKVLDDFSYTSFKNIGYSYIRHLNGTDNSSMYSGNGYLFKLANGAIIRLTPDGHYADSVNKTDYKYTNIIFYSDINGKRKPNVVGKDIFVFLYNTTTAKFGFYNYSFSSYCRDYIVKNYCNGISVEDRHCGQLILLDGWEIKDDYPW